MLQQPRKLKGEVFAKSLAQGFGLADSYTKNSVFIYTSFFLAFLLCSAVIYGFPDSPAIAASIFLIIFSLIAAITAFFFNKQRKYLSQIDVEKHILEYALQRDSAVFLIVDESGDIIFKENLDGVPNANKLTSNSIESILGLFSFSKDKLHLFHEQIRFAPENPIDFVFQDYDAALSYGIEIKKFLVPAIIEDGFEDVEKNDRVYTSVQIFRTKQDKINCQLADILDIAYYNLDEHGDITGGNDCFFKLINENKDQAVDKKINVFEYIEINPDNINNSFHDHRVSWDGFISIQTKYKEQFSAFLIHKVQQDRLGKITGIFGFMIRLADQSLALKSKGVEKGWIEYSWQCFFANSPYPVAILSLDGHIEKINDSFSNMIPGEVNNKQFEQLFKRDDQKTISAQIADIVKNKSDPRPITGVRLKDANTYLDVYLGKIHNLTGELYGFMVRIADITQQHELKQNLSHAQRMQTIGQLVGSVAHDFNNLLTAISGFCDLLFLRHGVGDPSFSDIMQIKQSADRASSLVKRLLAFSRKQTLKPQILNLNDHFADFPSLVQRLVGNDVVLEQEIESMLWNVKFDPVQMEQVLLNLVVNARHAMEAGGTLSIRVQNIQLAKKDPILQDYHAPPGEEIAPKGEYVMIEVSDTGCGIEEDIIPRIFDPFFTTKTEKSGTGLGLSTVYGIVRQSEGYIYVKSSPGIGSTFLILIRKHVLSKEEKDDIAHNEQAKIENENKLRNDTSGHGVIALIEDEEAVRLFAKSVLQSKGYEVIEFPSAKSALENIDSFINKVDLVISDVMMPEMSGPTFVKEALKRRPRLKVIYVSGYGEEAFTEEYGNRRDFNFLPKPFSLKDLVFKVKEVLKQGDKAL